MIAAKRLARRGICRRLRCFSAVEPIIARGITSNDKFFVAKRSRPPVRLIHDEGARFGIPAFAGLLRLFRPDIER